MKWPLSHGQVDRLLDRHGTHRPSYVRTPGPRYERAAANDLWHIDLKGPFFLVGATGRARTCHFVALMDDHSRFLLGIRAVPTKEAIWILDLLEEAVELCGVPHDLMTDDGTPFVAIARTILSRFQRTFEDLRIRHIRTQIDTPWTNGKVEAFWATLQREVLDRQQLVDLAAADPTIASIHFDAQMHSIAHLRERRERCLSRDRGLFEPMSLQQADESIPRVTDKGI